VEKLYKLGRLSKIHIKDGTGEMKGSAGRPLGMGSAPVAAVRAKAEELGLDTIVESETLTPSGTEEARICFAHLMSLEK
jgi:sugar phosphate isomerase/epimerase